VDARAELTLWRVRRAVRSMGWPAIGGLALAVFAAGLYLSSVAPLQAQVEELRAQVRQLEERVGAAPARSARSHDPDAQLATFYDGLPLARQAPEVVRRLHSHARESGLMLERGDYRPLPDPSGRLLRYQIQLPVRGSYPQVKAFLARALRTPGLALDGVGFQRDENSQALEAQLRFTVFLRAGT
jgi:Tfp pilus assembly protein PilO